MIRQCHYLTGPNLAPKTAKEARALIGKKIKYLRAGDIDSYRGMYFTRNGWVVDVHGKNIDISNRPDESGNWQLISRLIEVTEVTE